LGSRDAAEAKSSACKRVGEIRCVDALLRNGRTEYERREQDASDERSAARARAGFAAGQTRSAGRAECDWNQQARMNEAGPTAQNEPRAGTREQGVSAARVALHARRFRAPAGKGQDARRCEKSGCRSGPNAAQSGGGGDAGARARAQDARRRSGDEAGGFGKACAPRSKTPEKFARQGSAERTEPERAQRRKRIGNVLGPAAAAENVRHREARAQTREGELRSEGEPAQTERGQSERPGQAPASARAEREPAGGPAARQEGSCQHEGRGFENGSSRGSKRGVQERRRQRGARREKAQAAHASGQSRHFGRSLAKKDEMEKIRAPRGTADLYPPESALWQAFEARARALALRFGYGEIRTPLFEATELFERGVGATTDIVEKEMYTFTDKGGRSLTLRPEWTAPVVRALLEHNLLAAGAQRLYYLGPFFRYERPQAGRYRQANQFGIECFGFAGPEADVEVISLAHELVRSYDLPGVALGLNSIGDERCRPAYREALLAYFRPRAAALSADSQRRLERNPLRILDSKEPEDAVLVAGAPTFLEVLCSDCAAHFAAVCDLLERCGIPFRVEPRLVRGFDYYTRTVFQFDSDALGAQSTICGGGRYDDLVRSLGGPEVPAVGFGLGVERFLMVLERTGAQTQAAPHGIAVIALGAAARARAVPLVAALRHASAGVPISIDYNDAKIGAQFKKAERAGARAAVILGDEELARGEAIVRDMSVRVQDAIGMQRGDATAAETILKWYAALPSVAAIREAV